MLGGAELQVPSYSRGDKCTRFLIVGFNSVLCRKTMSLRNCRLLRAFHSLNGMGGDGLMLCWRGSGWILGDVYFPRVWRHWHRLHREVAELEVFKNVEMWH